MSKDYHQFCGLAKAASVLGERWAILILRNLSLGTRRFGGLQDGLPGIPTTVLTTRLRELEEHGIVERVAAPFPERGVLYTLTGHGQDIAPILDALGRWGARRMAQPAESDVITHASLAGALRSAYHPGVLPNDVTVHVIAGPAQAWARTSDDNVTVGEGLPERAADLTITTGPEMRLLLAGQLTPSEALTSRAVSITGNRDLFALFPQAFNVPLDQGAAS
ncbi:MAG: helix-turn-helix domain-containing protein [Brachybacterium sp.]|nr:helix-turn-helix domain-containing protein [Brachybacterium sp.]